MSDLRYSRSGRRVFEVSGRATTIIVSVALVALGLTFVFLVMGSTSGMTRSHHGLYHSASVYQVWNGLVPPTNPLSMGGPAITYWGWYLFLSGLMRVFQISAFEAAILSNALALSALLVGLWLGTGLVRPRQLTRLSYCFVPLLVLQPHVFAAEAWGIGNLRIDLGQKFLNFNGFPPAVGLFSLLLYAVARPGRPSVWRVLSCAGLSAAICFIHATSGAAVIALAAAGIACHGLRWRQERPSSIAPYLAIAVAFAAMFPYMNSLRTSLGSSQTGSSLFVEMNQLGENLRLAGFSLAIPTLILIAGATRIRTLSTLGQVLWLTCLELTVGAILVRLPGANQYKFNLLLAVPSALLLCHLLTHDPARRAHVLLSRAGLVAAVLLTAAVGAKTVARYDSFPWASKDPYVYNGTNMDLRPTRSGSSNNLQEAYAWIRENTPVTAYVLERPKTMNTLEMSTIAQRRTVAARGGFLTQNVPHHEDLIARGRRMVIALESQENLQQRRRALLGVPLNWPAVFYALAKTPQGISSSELSTLLPPGIAMVFSNEEFAVYEVSTSR